jgi:hypothetical protein
MSYKCSMCQQPISPIDGEWGMQFSLSKWMHYKCIEHLWDVYSSMRKSDFIDDTRVRCTKDGDYPEDKETVFAEIHGQYFDGITHKLDFDKDNGLWIDYDGENIPHIPEEMTVYWQPLTSLKEQYEKQKEEEV